MRELSVTYRVTLPLALKPTILALLEAFQGPVLEDIEMKLAARHASRAELTRLRGIRYRERKAAKG